MEIQNPSFGPVLPWGVDSLTLDITYYYLNLPRSAERRKLVEQQGRNHQVRFNRIEAVNMSGWSREEVER